ncbi:cytoskeleton-associated protein 5-A-like isoform X1 [Hydra vulgaris]|uniref:Cytoskeleton-associated protein 5-A-like isoform X1 n=1 Tax=Hydra vulgaris TaxID=6087 RepID=A0ABM4C861_HYDVU
MKAQLADNNKVLVQLTISICKQLVESGGNGMIRHMATILPALIGTFTDAKPALFNLAEEALDAWHSKIGFVPFLDGEILFTSLQIQNPNLRATSIPPKSSGGGRKKDFMEDDGPPIILKVGKAQRIKDEKALKVLKWNFTIPRDEFLDQLKEQMMPCFSPSMHAKFFHKDFKFLIEALSILISCVTEYSEAVIKSLDIILK